MAAHGCLERCESEGSNLLQGCNILRPEKLHSSNPATEELGLRITQVLEGLKLQCVFI